MSDQNKKLTGNSQQRQKKYQQIKSRDINILEAIHEILNTKKSINRIKIGLISINRSDEIEKINWRSQQSKHLFLQICEQLEDYFEEEKDLEKSTEKNLSQMNEQISKMRKSLSQKGIIFGSKTQQLSSDEQQQQLRDDKYEAAQNESHIQAEVEKTQQKQDRKIEQNEGNQNNQSNIEGKQDGEASFQQKQQQKQRQAEIEQKQLSQQQQSHHQVSNQQQIKHQSQNKASREAQYDETNKIQNKNIDQMPQKHPDIQQKVDQEKVTNQYNQQANEQMEAENETLWTQIPMPEQNKQKARNNKKLDTLPQQLDNEFYEQQMGPAEYKQKSPSQQKKPKYNPHLEIMKKQSKAKKWQQPQGKNQQQNLYYNLQRKLILLFAIYLKQLKTSSFTFDGHPQCLDIKTFSSYFKHFKLGEFCKIAQIPKYFKKCSINGTWMNEQNFIIIHNRILNLGDDPIATINENLKKLQQNKVHLQKQLQKLHQSKITDKQKQSKQSQLKQTNKQVLNKLNELQQNLKKINILITDQQIKNLTRKNKSSQPSAVPLNNNNNTYDPERLKKIVEAHSGIYKQDIIQKLNDRKREKEKRHQQQVHKILQKYKGQPSSHANSASSFSKNKNNQSAPHLRKVQGYAKRNQIIKHGPNFDSPKNERLKSQPKNKPYLIKKQLGQLQNSQLQTRQMPKNEKKIQVYKQLSLPKLPKRKMREQSIYESLKMIDTKAELQFIKNLLIDKSQGSKQDEKIFNEFYAKQKSIIQKQKVSKTPVQNRMKFT